MLCSIARKFDRSLSITAPSAGNGVWIKQQPSQQHDGWVQKFALLMPHLTPFRRSMVLPCRYCKLQAVNRHTHWRNCLVVQVSYFLGLTSCVPPAHGADGTVRAGTDLLRGGVCPTLLNPGPKREREEGSPEGRKPD